MQRARLRRVPPGALSSPLSLSSLLSVRTRFHPCGGIRVFPFAVHLPLLLLPLLLAVPSPFGAPPFSPRATFIARRDKPARSGCRLRLILQLSLIQRIPRGTLLLLPSIWNRWNFSSPPLHAFASLPPPRHVVRAARESLCERAVAYLGAAGKRRVLDREESSSRSSRWKFEKN